MLRLFLFFIVSIHFSIVYGQSKLDSGLISFYPFNCNANDESGNENHGEIKNATFSKDRFGNINSAILLNAAKDSILLGDLDINTQEVTIQFWIKTSIKNQKTAYILSKYDGDGNSDYPYIFGLRNDGSILFAIRDSKTFYTYRTNSNSNSFDIRDGKWHRVLGIRDQGILKVYVDEFETGTCRAVTGILDNNLKTIIGLPSWHSTNTVEPFFGEIDDLRFYNRAFSSSEIHELYEKDFQIHDRPKCRITIYDTIRVVVYDTLIINSLVTTSNDQQKEISIKIFPNPTKEIVNFDVTNHILLQEHRLKISNSFGLVKYNEAINSSVMSVNISDLGGDGLYFVYLIDQNNRIQEVKKLIVK